MDMTLNQFQHCLVGAAQSPVRLPMMAWSAPGVGKSALIIQTAQLLREITGEHWGVIDERLSQLDSVDLRGVPDVQSGRTKFMPPDWLPDEERDGKRGILFLDELTLAEQSTQHAGYQLILDGALGSYTLPKGWIVVAASNRSQDKTGVGSLNSALMNRFAVHAEIVVDFESWAQWAADAGIRPEIVAFLSFRRELLHEYPEGGMPKGTRAFASPRTWAYASGLLDLQLPADEEHASLCGCVGRGPASEFAGFLQIYRNLPDIRALIADPDGSPLPTDPAVQYAIAACVSRMVDRHTFRACARLCERMAPEFAVLMVRQAVSRDETLKQAPGYSDFKITHQQTL